MSGLDTKGRPIAALRTALSRTALLAAFFSAGAVNVAHAQPAAIVTPTVGGDPWTAAGVAKLSGDLDADLADAPAIRGAHVAVLALDTRSGAVLYARNADDEFQPASTLKLLVGSAALERLGPAFRFRTEVDVSRSMSARSSDALDSIVLVAGGDPFLTMADLRDAAARAAARGIMRVRGVLIDDSHFDTAPYPAGWVWDDFGQDYAPHISAVALEENLVHLTVSPGSAVGGRAYVAAGPAVNVGMFYEGCLAERATAIAVVPLATTGRTSAASTIDVGILPGGCLAVTGTIPLGSNPQSIDGAAYDPVVYAERAFSLTLHDAGIVPGTVTVVTGGIDDAVRWTPVPGLQPQPIWSHESDPLGMFLGPRFWIPSDNFVGEMLLRQLGFAAAGKPGTTDKGLAYERAWLGSIGVDPQTTTLADGSGLSQYDRITPRDLVAILQHDWNGPNRQLVLNSLPVGGARGTIEGIAGTPAAGRAFAKTGSMSHVRGLAGYLATQRHGAVTFAFNVDDWNGDYAALAALRARVLSRIVSD
ncbi:MAG: D-alanyl-D-alanine carboxypeptidase/D-alanyl-D-alanine-endopeptidase [Candidatus Eremiobacteraeota bacterium]|nr:D-alanyl-D-alanine carboxypeptidase/D-alanyl-D-alanine-endopeptidase [Candidatus Eremiobacteraeota bacterium]MBC5802401.1 D-alanyl-D-alanine carboxypeptidase/D-alanyl-D-alanine-endopeptidase [Candidatus Eremiobacteraeota bacterium]MBC5820619.1 D-alanyl-D-alanine carboxypeptidase/D-alanyl-D-alanine-endopeptidase [Candidatus Eremiobacteraeota bacterium]